MPGVMDEVDYAFAPQHFSCVGVWKFFGGDSMSFNIAHECIERHALDDARVTVRFARADGRDDALTFHYVADRSSRFAQWLRPWRRRQRTRGDKTGTLADLLRGLVRSDQARRDRTAAVQFVRA